MGLPRARVDEMLELVSLSPAEAKRRVKNYSLGMRQRLGIAHALIGDPQILILDEPANGLDPAGIHWMRGLLKEYAVRGGTVLLSSHLLHEVEKIADDLILIGHGRIVAQGTKQELLHARGAFVRAVEHEALRDALHAEGIHAVPSGEGLRSDVDAIQIGKVAAANAITLDRAPARRRLRARGPVPPAHRRHPTRRHPGRGTGMTATTFDPGAVDPRHLADAAPSRSPDWSGSSCASWSTPARASG